MRYLVFILLSTFFAITAVHAADDFMLTSATFNNGGKVPIKYTCDGDNISPPLIWKNAPANSQSYVLIFYNPDAPYGTFYHWVLYNIPPNVNQLVEGANHYYLPKGTLVGNTSSNDAIYRGPCPPNAADHHYIFDLYALDAKLDLQPGADIDEIVSGMKNHILKQARLIVTFKH